MSFDLNTARQRGTDEEITQFLQSKVPHFDFNTALQRGSLDEVVTYLDSKGLLEQSPSTAPVAPPPVPEKEEEKGFLGKTQDAITSGLEYSTGLPSFVSDVVKAAGTVKAGSYIPIGHEVFNKAYEEGKRVSDALDKTSFTVDDLTNEQLEQYNFYQKYLPVKRKAEAGGDILQKAAAQIVPDETQERISKAQQTVSSPKAMIERAKKDGLGSLATDVVIANTSQISNLLMAFVPGAQAARLTGALSEDLESVGVTDPVLKAKYAQLGGIGSGSIEQASDLVFDKLLMGSGKALKAGLGKKATKKLSKAVVKKSVTRILAKNLALYGVNLTKEGIEEVAQGKTEDLIKIIAIQDQLKKTNEPGHQEVLLKNLKELSDKNLGDYSEEFFGGIMGSLLLTGAGATTQTIGDVAANKKVGSQDSQVQDQGAAQQEAQAPSTLEQMDQQAVENAPEQLRQLVDQEVTEDGQQTVEEGISDTQDTEGGLLSDVEGRNEEVGGSVQDEGTGSEEGVGGEVLQKQEEQVVEGEKEEISQAVDNLQEVHETEAESLSEEEKQLDTIDENAKTLLDNIDTNTEIQSDEEILNPLEAYARQNREVWKEDEASQRAGEKSLNRLMSFTKDKVTGWSPKAVRDKVVEIIMERGRRGAAAVIDLGNLGGINAFTSGKLATKSGLKFREDWAKDHGLVSENGKVLKGHEATDKILTNIVNIMNDNLEGMKVSNTRVGGDEFNIIGLDMDSQILNESLVKADTAVRQYIEELGLSDLPHPKQDMMATGVGIDFGVIGFDSGEDIFDLLGAADVIASEKKMKKLNEIAQREGYILHEDKFIKEKRGEDDESRVQRQEVEEAGREVRGRREGTKIIPEVKTGVSEEVSKQEVPVTGEPTKPKDIKKYTFNDLVSFRAEGKEGNKKIRAIASEAGIKFSKQTQLATVIKKYVDKYGNDKDKDRAREYVKTETVKKGHKGKAKAPPSEQTVRGAKGKILKEGAVKYDPEVHEELLKSDNYEKIDTPDGPVVIHKEVLIEKGQRERVSSHDLSFDQIVEEGGQIRGSQVNIDIVQDVSPSQQLEIKKIIETESPIKYDSKTHDSLIKKGYISKFTEGDNSYVDLNITAGDGVVRLRRRTAASNKEIGTDTKTDAVKALFKMLPKKLSDNTNIHFVDEVITIEGEKFDLTENGDTDAFFTLDGETEGEIDVYISKTLGLPATMRAASHEMFGHVTADKVLAINDDLRRRRDALFAIDRESEFTKKLEDDYEEDLMAAYKKGGQKLAEEVLRREWLAHRIHQLNDQTLYDSSGKIREGVPKVLNDLYNLIKQMIRAMTVEGRKINEIDSLAKDIIKEFPKVSDLDSLPAYDFVLDGNNLKLKRARKFRTEPERLRFKTIDRKRLENSKDTKEFKKRLVSYLTNHVKSTEILDKIIDHANKIRTLEQVGGKFVDRNVRTIIEIIDSNNLRGDLGRVSRSAARALRFQKTQKVPAELAGAVKQLSDWKNSADLYRRLKIYMDSKDYSRKIIKDTPGKTVRELINAGFVKIVDGKTKITDKGITKLNELTQKLNSFKDHVGNTLDPVSAVDYHIIKLNQEKQNFSEVKGDIANKRREKIQNEVNELRDKLVMEKGLRFNPKMEKKITGRILKFAGDAFNHASVWFSNFRHIMQVLDNFDPDGPFQKYFSKRALEGENKSNKWFREAGQILQELREVENLDSISPALRASGMFNSVIRALSGSAKLKKYTFKDTKDRNVELTGGQKISVYMMLENADGYRHLTSERGGLKLSKDDTEKHILTLDSIEQLYDSMTEDELKIVKILRKYFDFQGKKINEVSLEDVGYELATEDKYFPLLTDSYYTDYAENPLSLENSAHMINQLSFGNLKYRVKNASNPVILEDAFDAVARTHSLVSRYIGLKPVVKDIQALLHAGGAAGDQSVKVEYEGENISFKDLMAKFGYTEQFKMINKILGENIKNNRPGVDRPLYKALKTFRGLKTIGVLGYNIPVMTIQPVSYGSAFVGPFGLNPDLALKNDNIRKEVLADFMDHSDLLWSRYQNKIDLNFAEAFNTGVARSLIFEEPRLVKARELLNPTVLLSAKGAMAPLAWGDSEAISRICNGVKNELEADGVEYDTKEFWDKAVPRVEEIIHESQPEFSPWNRPIIMQSEMLKSFTMFMTQPMKNFQMLHNSIGRTYRAIKTNDQEALQVGLRDLINVAVLQPLVVAVLREGWRSARGIDEEEKWIKKVGMSYLNTFLSMLPLVGTILTDLISGYEFDMSLPMEETLINFTRTMKKVGRYINGEDKDTEKLIKQINKTLKDVGIPTSGIQHFLEIYLNVKGDDEDDVYL